MDFAIYIEDLAANAFIQILTKDEHTRFLTYSEIENYGKCVVRSLSTKNTKAILVLSRDMTNEMLRDYSEFFAEIKKDGKTGLELKENKSVTDLINQFRGYLSLDLLLAFVSKDVQSSLNKIVG